MKFLILLILLIPSNSHVLFIPQRIWNHFGNEKVNSKKVKIVPVKERFTFPKPIKSKGLANIHPNIYKKGIKIIVDNNFGPEKNNFKYDVIHDELRISAASGINCFIILIPLICFILFLIFWMAHSKIQTFLNYSKNELQSKRFEFFKKHEFLSNKEIKFSN